MKSEIFLRIVRGSRRGGGRRLAAEQCLGLLKHEARTGRGGTRAGFEEKWEGLFGVTAIEKRLGTVKSDTRRDARIVEEFLINAHGGLRTSRPGVRFRRPDGKGARMLAGREAASAVKTVERVGGIAATECDADERRDHNPKVDRIEIDRAPAEKYRGEPGRTGIVAQAVGGRDRVGQSHVREGIGIEGVKLGRTGAREILKIDRVRKLVSIDHSQAATEAIEGITLVNGSVRRPCAELFAEEHHARQLRAGNDVSCRGGKRCSSVEAESGKMNPDVLIIVLDRARGRTRRAPARPIPQGI